LGLHANMRCGVAAVQMTPALLVRSVVFSVSRGTHVLQRTCLPQPPEIVVRDEHENRKFPVTCWW